MKNTFLLVTLTTVLCQNFFANKATAETTSTLEGASTAMSDADVQDLTQWVKNAKHSLEVLRETVRPLTTLQKNQAVYEEFQMIVSDSGQKSNELLVRYVLNRALTVSDVLKDRANARDQESLLNIYNESIDMALKVYADDESYLKAIGKGENLPAESTLIAEFGKAYAEKLLAFSPIFIDPVVEYKITRDALGFLGNDLNSPRNLSRALYSSEIVKIQKLLSENPAEPAGTTQSIVTAIRKMKFEYREILQPALQKTAVEAGQSQMKMQSERELADSKKFDWGQPFKVGDLVWAAVSYDPQNYYDANVRAAEVVAVKDTHADVDRFQPVIKFQTSGELKSPPLSNISYQKGCIYEFCVGDEAFYIQEKFDSGQEDYDAESNRVLIIGVSPHGKFAIKRIDNYKDTTTIEISTSDLAESHGCLGEFCVGDTIFDSTHQKKARVIGFRRSQWEPTSLKYSSGGSAKLSYENAYLIERPSEYYSDRVHRGFRLAEELTKLNEK